MDTPEGREHALFGLGFRVEVFGLGFRAFSKHSRLKDPAGPNHPKPDGKDGEASKPVHVASWLSWDADRGLRGFHRVLGLQRPEHGNPETEDTLNRRALGP